jgi:hypothetical protein
MSQSDFTIWGMLVLMAFGALAGPLIYSNVFGAIRAAFSADRARCDALRRRGKIAAEFSRFGARPSSRLSRQLPRDRPGESGRLKSARFTTRAAAAIFWRTSP